MASAWGGSWGSAWGNSWGSIAPVPGGGGTGRRRYQSHSFSRKRFEEEIKELLAAKRAMLERSEEVKAAPRKALVRAAAEAQKAADVAEGDLDRLTELLEQATRANKASEIIALARRAEREAIRLREEEQEDEVVVLMLLT